MRWLGAVLIGPMLWALVFGLVYGLHGVFCVGHSTPEQLDGSARLILALIWAAGLLVFWPLFRRLARYDPPGADLPRAGLWIGLGATAFTLFPVTFATSC